MNIERFREIIAHRIYVEKISYGEWDEGIEECKKKEIEILTEDIPATIEFLKNDCTAYEYVWISEIFDDIINLSPSKELVQCYKELMEKFPDESSRYYIADVIEDAETILKCEDEHGEKD